MKVPIAAEGNRRNPLYNNSSAILAILSTMLLVLVPLTFSTTVYRFYTLPRFAVLLIGASAVFAMLFLQAIDSRPGYGSLGLLKNNQTVLVSLYLICITISTAFGVAPLNSLFGSFENQMGLITHLCFFICFVGLIAGAGKSWARLEMMLWAMLITALLISVYAVAQFFGIEPFVQSGLYTFKSATGNLVRVCSTLGHADYLGNFLLYTAFVAPALAITSSGRSRRIAMFASVLIIFAIICSGTRGAWLGLLFGLLVFSIFEFKSAAKKFAQVSRNHFAMGALIAVIIVLLSGWLLISSPTSSSISRRAKSFVEDGFTGSGRTLLWRDAIKMVPTYALTGSGSEGFRKAFLEYKSKELAQLAPQTNNESSHNSFLDAAISYGLCGLFFYTAVIASTFRLLFAARRRTNSLSEKVMISGLFASFVAVIAHNFFIFDQLSTGLYFYAFAALAQIVSLATGSRSEGEENRKVTSSDEEQMVMQLPGKMPIRAWISVVIGIVFVATALWYSFSLLRADRNVKRAFAFADSGNMEGVINDGKRATNAAEPTGNYDFLFAQALVRYAERLPAPTENNSNGNDARATVLALAKLHASKSLTYTFTPDSNYLLLAYIGWLSGNVADLKSSAQEAVQLDPYFANARWLMAQSLMAEGLYDEASREAELAMELNPYSREAKLAFRKAQQNSSLKEPLIHKYLSRSSKAAEAGERQKAKRLILRALKLANGSCPECHRSLALVYEMEQQYKEAIAEWHQFLKQAPERAAVEKVSDKLKTLAQQDAESKKANPQ